MKEITDKMFEENLVIDRIGEVGTSNENKFSAIAAALVACIHDCGENKEERVFYSSMFNSLLSVNNINKASIKISEETHQACEQELDLQNHRNAGNSKSANLDAKDLHQKCVRKVTSKAQEVLAKISVKEERKDKVDSLPATKRIISSTDKLKLR